MRGWLGMATIVALLAGCAPPPGVDGDLADDWTVVGEPTPPMPVAGQCQKYLTGPVMSLFTYAPISCQEDHVTETAHVGSFSGAASQGTSPPPVGSPARRQAFAECDVRVREFLGGYWHSARMRMRVAVPSDHAWSGGARWFLCELIETVDLDDPNAVQRKATLKDALKSPSDLHRGCAQYASGAPLTAMACTAAHNAEFTGVFFVPDIPYQDATANRTSYARICEALIANFVGVSRFASIATRLGLFWYPPSEEAWDEGDRGIPCYLWTEGMKVSRSLRGVGMSGIPRS